LKRQADIRKCAEYEVEILDKNIDKELDALIN